MNVLKNKIKMLIWDVDIDSMSVWKRRLFNLFRMIYVIVRDLAEGQLTLRAMSLVYTTLLSIVPLLAVSFSVLKGFGVHNQIKPNLEIFLAPLGEKGVEITNRIIEFVENIQVGVLGSVGLVFLLYTVIALIQKIERSFNYTWHLSHNRPFAQRFSDYLSVILIGPVLVFTSLGITATITSTPVVQELAAIRPLGDLIHTMGRLVPYLLIIAAFTFVYTFVPNTKVRVGSALIGAVVAGLLWETAGWLFASFVVSSAKYTAIYSAFATLILFMIWLYVGWLILLVGASIAFYHQHPEYMTVYRRELRVSNRMKERIALHIMYLIGLHFYKMQPPWTIEALSRRLNIPIDVVQLIILNLEEEGLLSCTDSDPREYIPAKPLDLLHIKPILDIVRAADEDSYLNPRRLTAVKNVDEVLYNIDNSINDALDNYTLRQLILNTHEFDENIN